MTDLHARFRALDSVPTPDLWDEVRLRVEGTVGTESVRRADVDRVMSPKRGAPFPLRRAALLVALAGLLLVGTIGTGLIAGSLSNRLTSPTALPSLSVLPENGLIAVSANPNDVGGGEVGDIYLVSEGAPARRIIGSVGDGIAQECPRFSPDGRDLAYGEARASDPVTTFRGVWPVTDRAVVVVGLNDLGDASPPKLRVTVPGGGSMICPEWSPSGGQVASVVGSELWVTEVASAHTTVVSVIPQSGFEQNEVEWSRDGSRIAVAEPGRIRIVHPADGASTLISVEGGTPRSLGWTAGDQRIVYVTTDSPGDGRAVHVVDADGNNDIQLTPRDPEIGFRDSPVSPDGTRVAFLQSRTRCTSDGCTGDPPQLMVMDTDGSNEVELPISSDIGLNALQWAPDGKRLLLSSIDGVFSVALTPRSPVVDHSSGELNLEWSASEVTWQPVFPASPAPIESEAPAATATGPTRVGSSVHVGGWSYTGEAFCLVLSDGGLSITSGDQQDGDMMTLVFRPDGTVSSLSGLQRGVIWEVTQNPQGTLKPDRSGTFSGKDAISGADVSGTFACQ